jgi:hypothetical protein
MNLLIIQFSPLSCWFIFKKRCPTTCYEVAWGEEYSSYSFSTTALDGVSGQRHGLAALSPGERTAGAIGQELGEPQSRSGHRG